MNALTSKRTARQIGKADSLSHRTSFSAIYHFITWAFAPVDDEAEQPVPQSLL